MYTFLDSRSHIGFNEYFSINWLPVESRANQIICSMIYKFFNNQSPLFMHDVFLPISGCGGTTRRSFQRLTVPSRSKVPGMRALSFLGPNLWNSLPHTKTKSFKSSNSVNDFKHGLKKLYFNLMNTADKSIYVYTK